MGEVRGKEALELLNSYNTGHDGGMSTGHGNSPADMLARLETMVLMGADLPLGAIRSQIASALDILIHLGRLRDKSRKVLWITEVDGYEEGEIRLHSLYEFQEERDGENKDQQRGGRQREDGKEGAGRQSVSGRLRKKGELRHREKLWMAGEAL